MSEKDRDMGRVVVAVRLWNMLDEKRIRTGELQPIEVEALIDTGSYHAMISDKLARQLDLLIEKEITVILAHGRKVKRHLAVGLRVEAFGRTAVGQAIIEPSGEVPLLGQFFLESTCLLVDCRGQKLVPDPTYGGEEVHEVLTAVMDSQASPR